ncbi:hypothetical protein TIFTF001_001576 [Ficus carica]|uniref:WAT1-related protein n=1 Tax=Ficus carica TaxID=3494 RepID=A0AA87Z0R2_FICCA|nr:hypothetical protein TIFTF001_001576 [Ficus carica]
MRSKREIVIEESKPYILCLICVLVEAGYNIISKVTLDKGMSCYVLVFYGYAFGTLATALLAFLFERNNESKISIPILRNVFFLSLFGGVVVRTLYYVGLEYTSPVFTSVLSNTIPSMTFILAVLCRMEKFDITKRVTQAKVGGTVVAFAGATIMTLYKGIAVISVRLTHYSHRTSTSVLSFDKNWIKGSLLLFVSYFSFSASFILQSKTVKVWPAPMTLTSLTCLVATILSAIMAAILDHKAASWRLSWNITLLAPLYNGIVIFGITFYVQNLVLRRKGPVFVTAFRPLGSLLVAIMALLILGEALHLGSIVGAMLIIIGLYAILWGKKEESTVKIPLERARSEQDVETKLEK